MHLLLAENKKLPKTVTLPGTCDSEYCLIRFQRAETDTITGILFVVDFLVIILCPLLSLKFFIVPYTVGTKLKIAYFP